jgi:hypothetical protein
MSFFPPLSFWERVRVRASLSLVPPTLALPQRGRGRCWANLLQYRNQMTTDSNAFPFTHSRLEAIKPPKTGRDSYRDTKVAGLTFVITANASKSFYFYHENVF